MKKVLLKIWYWIVESSKDPRKISLTIKAAVAAVAIYAATASHIFGLPGLTEEGVNEVGESAAQIASNGLMIVSLLMTTWGLVRKLIATMKGWKPLKAPL